MSSADEAENEKNLILLWLDRCSSSFASYRGESFVEHHLKRKHWKRQRKKNHILRTVSYNNFEMILECSD